MTSTTPPTSEKSSRTRLPLVLITNLCVAVFMLVAVPVIYKGQQGFVPHAVVNKEYVNAAISSGEADFMNNALKTTEIARAMAHDSHVSSLAVMQMAVGVLAALFFINSLYLFWLHRQPQAVQIPSAS